MGRSIRILFTVVLCLLAWGAVASPGGAAVPLPSRFLDPGEVEAGACGREEVAGGWVDCASPVFAQAGIDDGAARSVCARHRAAVDRALGAGRMQSSFAAATRGAGPMPVVAPPAPSLVAVLPWSNLTWTPRRARTRCRPPAVAGPLSRCTEPPLPPPKIV